jgi:drug/metabolite transporter (DMT)-like permease
LKVVLAFACIYFIWGSTYLAIRFAVETMPPLLMAGVRFLIAGGLLYGWLALRRETRRPTREEWKAAAILGVLFFLGGNGAVSWSETRIPSGLAALLVATIPVWIVILDWVRPGGTRPSAAVSVSSSGRTDPKAGSTTRASPCSWWGRSDGRGAR